MTIANDAIAASIAALTPVAKPPAPPFGHGTDLACVSDISAAADEVDPWSMRALAEILVRRLTTPRSALVDAPEWGFDVRSLLHAGLTETELRLAGTQVRGELTADDRVSDATVSVSYAQQTLTITALVTPVDPAVGAFTLTFAVSDTGQLQASIG